MVLDVGCGTRKIEPGAIGIDSSHDRLLAGRNLEWYERHAFEAAQNKSALLHDVQLNIGRGLARAIDTLGGSYKLLWCRVRNIDESLRISVG